MLLGFCLLGSCHLLISAVFGRWWWWSFPFADKLS
uniref:Uncharacterized protein n=1 Tax=Manihot esculenta TaxID=3983 RepID=A0A2C9U2Z0_MANES